MFNEVAQWAVLLIIAVLVLGFYRQLSLSVVTMSDHTAEETGPPVGRRAPTVLLQALRSAAGKDEVDFTVALITENCIGCQRLLAAIEAHPERPGGPAYLVLKEPSIAFRKAAAEINGAVVLDDDEGQIWAACNVSATPLVMSIGPDDRVRRKGVTHDVDAIAHASEVRTS